MPERQGFYLYHEDIEALQSLTSEQKGILLEALFNFSVNGDRLKTDNVAIGVAFGMMSAKIARDAEKYRQKSERYSHSARQRESNRRIMQNDHNFENFQNSQIFENSENPAKHSKIVPTVTVPVSVTETVSVPVTETVKNNVVVFNRGQAPGTPPPFTPPLLEEVQDYCYQRGSSVDPLRFHTYYTARGWMMGKTPMTDWRSAIQWWEQRDEEENRKAAVPDPAPYDEEPVRWFS